MPRGEPPRQPPRPLKKRKRSSSARHPKGDTLRRLFEGDPTTRMKVDLDAEDSRSSEDSGRAPRHRRSGKAKTAERVRRPGDGHQHDSDPFVTCSNGDELDRQHRQEPTGCSLGVTGGGGEGGEDTPPESDGGDPPPPYQSSEGTLRRPESGIESRWDSDGNGDGSRGEPSGGGPPGYGPPGGGSPGGGPPAGPAGRNLPEDIWRWIVYLHRRIQRLEREV